MRKSNRRFHTVTLVYGLYPVHDHAAAELTPPPEFEIRGIRRRRKPGLNDSTCARKTSYNLAPELENRAEPETSVLPLSNRPFQQDGAYYVRRFNN